MAVPLESGEADDDASCEMREHAGKNGRTVIACREPTTGSGTDLS